MKKLSKKIMTCTIAVMMAVSGLAVLGAVDTADAAAKLQLSKKKVTLNTGKTTKITVKNAKKKVTWKSGNKKIVTIKKKTGKRNQTAVLKAGKKTGTCYVRAKIGKKVLKCRVTVKKKKVSPSKPTEPEIEILPLSGDLEDLSADYNYEPVADTAVPEAFAKAVSEFSVKLLQETMKAERNAAANVLVSPDSVMTALTMTENGAAGSTLAEMHTVLTGNLQLEDLDAEAYNTYLSSFHSRLEKPDKPLYTSANSIWVRKDLMKPAPAFVEKNKKLHDAITYQAPFTDQTVTDMNNWVYNNTRNMIRDIIDRLEPQMRAVLINAVAFEGRWAEPFQDSQVKSGSFTASDGTVQKVNMLEGSVRFDGCYMEINGGKAFCKPYEYSGTAGEKGIAFMGILPPEGTNIDTYVQGLSGQDFVDAQSNAMKKKVLLKIPEFKYDYSTSMKTVLNNMGIKEAFTENADFSNMSAAGNKEVFIDEVLHKTHKHNITT